MEIRKHSKPKKKSVKIQTNSPKYNSKLAYQFNTKSKSITLRRSQRNIKKRIINDIYISNIDEIINTYTKEEEENIIQLQSKDEITFKGQLIYRFSLDQIEFKGEWTLSSPKEKLHNSRKQSFAYLLMKKERIIFTLNKHQIDFTDSHKAFNQSNEHKYFKGDTYSLSISSGNILELLFIQSPALLNHILLYLSGNYSGYFICEGKAIVDDFFINFLYDNDTIRIIGNGENNYGKFQLAGNIDFIKSKEDVIKNNENQKDKDEVSLGEITMIKTYSNHIEINK